MMNYILALIILGVILALWFTLLKQKISQSTFGWNLIPCLLLLIGTLKFDSLKEIDFRGLKLTIRELDLKKQEVSEKISDASSIIKRLDSATQNIYLAIAEQNIRSALEDKVFVGDSYAQNLLELKSKAIENLGKAKVNVRQFAPQWDSIDGKVALALASNIQDSIWNIGNRVPPKISRTDAFAIRQEMDRALFRKADPKKILSIVEEILTKFKIDESLIKTEIEILRQFVLQRHL